MTFSGKQLAARLKPVVISTACCCILLLPACSTRHSSAPVTSVHFKPIPASNQYVVRQGDTLYGIAWEYGLDYRVLAKINNINSSYKIFPGQQLFLTKSKKTAGKSVSTNSNQKVSNHKPSKGKTAVKTPPNSVKIPSPSIKKDNSKPVHAVHNVKEKQKKSVTNWRWPVKGILVGKFSESANGNKGIDIAAKPGDKVHAVADGKVVYSGNGLRGYGNLIIIKHDKDYLSAYAHNQHLYVKENDLVKAGQVIADIGKSGAARYMLHFEIRFRGTPVDPLKYLPKQ